MLKIKYAGREHPCVKNLIQLECRIFGIDFQQKLILNAEMSRMIFSSLLSIIIALGTLTCAGPNLHPGISISSSDGESLPVSVLQAINDYIGPAEGNPAMARISTLKQKSGKRYYVVAVEHASGGSTLFAVNGENYEVIQPDPQIQSHAGTRLEVDLKDLTCDQEPEIVIGFGGGGTLADGYFLSVYQIHDKSILRIFQHPVYYYPEELNFESGEVFFVDLGEDQKNCTGKIQVYAGQHLNKSLSAEESPSIKKTSSKVLSEFTYRPEVRGFQKIE